jgi:cell shape-determining protein MreC
MNYLHRANKHIASSQMTHQRSHGKKKSRGALFMLITLVVLVGLFFILKKPVASGFYGLKNLFVPDAPTSIELAPHVLNAELTALQLENDELRQLVGKRMEDGDAAAAVEREVVASVVMRPPQLPFDSLVIKAGANDGLQTGDQVYAFSSFPIGEIASVARTTSVVQLFSAPGNKIEVLIGTTTTAVMAEGKGGGNFFLKLPKVTEIKEGDIVMRTYLPPEAFSTIESVDSTAGEAYTYAYFKLPVNIHNIVYVIVKKNSAR